ncbi:hypothetical protein CUJ83_04070 [Methanocella sp. CWC-04]|uniref:Chemotaxis signal transduction system protein F from archaea n=1 Tax=Methanooceanicella nereidis TaxID=2052831 RepID=A0AAP2RCL9_9EURY|nr:CheF family chemotaxis protein [Methanocella sp. CWC-04]MCD1294170.1 hypothetical protein [Methanocella sp. CWC-04]
MEQETVVAKTNVDFISSADPDGDIDEKRWVKNGLIIITNQNLYLNNGGQRIGMPLKGLEDVEVREQNGKTILVITRYVNGKFNACMISAASQTIESLRKYFLQYISDAFKTSIYFISPASRGGVLLTTTSWDAGLLLATQKAIWFMSKTKRIRVGLENITRISRETRKISGKDRYVLVVNHVDLSEAVSSIVLCPDNTMDMLEKYLSDLTERYKIKDDQKFSEIEEQVATLVYSGVDSSAIQSMLNVDDVKIEEIYDKMLALGLAKVVRMRREMELTPKGVKYVTDIMNKVTIEKK